MNSDTEAMAFLALIVVAANVVIIWIALARLAAIKKEQTKTNYMIYKKLKQEGISFSKEEEQLYWAIVALIFFAIIVGPLVAATFGGMSNNWYSGKPRW